MTSTPWVEHLAMLPEDSRQRIRGYIEEGYGASLSTFYRCLISNDLIGAMQGADEENRAALPIFVEYLTAYAPADCYGSLEKLRAWRGIAASSA